jgi:hypothetical protein
MRVEVHVVSLVVAAIAFHGPLSLGAESRVAGADASAEAQAGAVPAPKLRVYSRLLDPREHPDYDRRHVKPPGTRSEIGRDSPVCGASR